MIEIREVRNLRGELDAMEDTIVRESGLTGVVGLFNWYHGLRNWRFAVNSRAGESSGGSGFGGVDIVVSGDSICGGAFGTSFLWDNMWFRARNKLQSYFNPSDVQGGFGTIPLILNGATWTRADDPVGSESNWLWTPSNAASWTTASGSSLQLGMRRAYHATNGNNSRARFVFDGAAATAVERRMQVTDIELLTSTVSGDATITWDYLTSDAFVSVGGGANTGTITGNAATNYGIHQGRQKSGLTKTDLHGIQVGVASGTANSRPDAVVAYCDDWDRGVRMHNLAVNGARSDFLAGTAATLDACVSKYGATAPGGTPAGATQAGLFVFGFYLNDVGLNASPTLTLAQFISYYTTLITTALACPSMPSVLIFIPQVRNNANTLANYAPYVAALYQLARDYNCALLDMNAWFGNSNYAGNVTLFNVGSGDATHYNDAGQELHANVVRRVLTN